MKANREKVLVARRRTRAKRRKNSIECYGCQQRFFPNRRVAQPVCPTCRTNPEIRWKVKWRLEQERLQKRIDAEAEAETAALNKKPVYNALIGERLVLMMQRGEW